MRRVPTTAWLVATLAILPASDPAPAQQADEAPRTEEARRTKGLSTTDGVIRREPRSGDVARTRAPGTTAAPSSDAPELHPVYRLKVGIRPRKSMLSKPIRSIERGECVEILETDAGWVRVRHGTVEGWIPKGDLKPKKRFDVREAAGKIDPDDPEAVRGSCGAEAAAAKG